MLVLGLVLILLAAGTLVAALFTGGNHAHNQLFGTAVDVSTLVVFLAGAATLLVFIMGLELVRSGLRRANTNRKSKKKLRTYEKREEQRTDVPADQGTRGGVDTDATQGRTGTPGSGSGGPYETPPPPSH